MRGLLPCVAVLLHPALEVLAEALWVELEAHGVLSLGVSFLAPLNVLSLDIYAIPRLARRRLMRQRPDDLLGLDTLIGALQSAPERGVHSCLPRPCQLVTRVLTLVNAVPRRDWVRVWQPSARAVVWERAHNSRGRGEALLEPYSLVRPFDHPLAPRVHQ